MSATTHDPTPSASPSLSVWIESSMPDGRKYYFNSSTGESTWERPSDFQPTSTNVIAGGSVTTSTKAANSAATVAASIAASWRELIAQNGKKYYYNSVTKVSVWEMPADYRDYLERQKDPNQFNREEAEEIFFAMLRERGVESKFTWEEALREVINHPSYKVLPTLADRKAAFKRYVEIQRNVEREQRYQLAVKAREDYKQLILSHPKIKYTMRWSEAMDILKDEPVYKALDNIRERAELYDEAITELRRKSLEESRIRRKHGLEKLNNLLMLNLRDQIHMDTKWKDALVIISGHEEFQNDADLQSMDPLDLLIGFEDYIKIIEKEAEDNEHLSNLRRKKLERTLRHQYKNMLETLVKDGKITAVTSWADVYSMIKNDAAFKDYINICGGFSSSPLKNPLEIYWEIADQLQVAYEPDRSILLTCMTSKYGGSWPKDMRVDSLKKLVESMKCNDKNTANINLLSDTKHYNVFIEEFYSLRRAKEGEEAPRMVESIEHAGKLEEATDASEHPVPAVDADDKKRWRREIDQYKHLLKKFDQPKITMDSKWTELRLLLSHDQSFQNLDNEEIRKNYFYKYLIHLKKKEGRDEESQDANDRKGPSKFHKTEDGSNSGGVKPRSQNYDSDDRRSRRHSIDKKPSQR